MAHFAEVIDGVVVRVLVVDQEFIDTFDTFRKQQNPKYKGSKKISY